MAIGALASMAVLTASPMANAANEPNWTNGCRGYWYTTSFHGYCSSVTRAGDFQLFGGCNNEPNYYGKWIELSRGYSGKFDADECTFKVNSASVFYSN